MMPSRISRFEIFGSPVAGYKSMVADVVFVNLKVLPSTFVVKTAPRLRVVGLSVVTPKVTFTVAVGAVNDDGVYPRVFA